MLTIPQLGRIKTKDVHVHDALKSTMDYINSLAQALGLDANKTFPIPPPISELKVTQNQGMFRISVVENAVEEKGRLLNYFCEYDTDPGFTNPIVIPMGASRDTQVMLGAQTLYFRGYSQYFGSAPSDKVYFGGGSPRAVVGNGPAPPARLPSQGSGGGAAGGGGFGDTGTIQSSGEGQGDNRLPRG